jgi:hypothetical protein
VCDWRKRTGEDMARKRAEEPQEEHFFVLPYEAMCHRFREKVLKCRNKCESKRKTEKRRIFIIVVVFNIIWMIK